MDTLLLITRHSPLITIPQLSAAFASFAANNHLPLPVAQKEASLVRPLEWMGEFWYNSARLIFGGPVAQSVRAGDS